MSAGALSLRARLGTAAAVLAAAGFVALAATAPDRHLLAIPIAAGLVAGYPVAAELSDRDRRNILRFAYGLHVFFWFYIYEAWQYTGGTRFFPMLVGYTGIALTFLDVIATTQTRPGRAIAGLFAAGLSTPPEGHTQVDRELGVVAGLAALLLAVYLFGFLVGGPAAVFVWMRVAGRKPPRLCAYVAGGTLAFLWLLFELILRYELFRGVAVEALLDALGA